MRALGIRVTVAGLLVVAGLLASCSAAHGRAGAQSRGGTQSGAGNQSLADGRSAGVRASVHAQVTSAARLQASRGPRWSQGKARTCVPPALVRAAGHVMGAGTCSGQLARPPLKVTLAVGQRIDVHLTGAGLVGLPHSSFPSVLAPGSGNHGRATQTYRAARAGHAALVSHAQACVALRHIEVKEVPGNCPVVAVTVVR